jgi:hypothetical protein
MFSLADSLVPELNQYYVEVVQPLPVDMLKLEASESSDATSPP